MSYAKALYIATRNGIEKDFIEKFGFVLLLTAIEIAGLILFC